MKQMTFIEEERSILLDGLKKRIAYFNIVLGEFSANDEKGKSHFEDSHIKPLVTALNKISMHESSILTNKEKSSCIICINNQIDEYYNELNSLTTTLSWLTISDHIRKVAYNLDNSKDMLMKFGIEFNDDKNFILGKEFRFGNVLSAIEKLKRTNKILLSCSGKNDYFKIAFVYEDKEYLLFDLNHQVSLKDFVFTSLNDKSPEDMAKEQFNLITNKIKAKELIATRLKYPDGELDLFNVLLS